MAKMSPSRGIVVFLFTVFFSRIVYAQDIMATLGSVNSMLYGIAAGLAVLMITFHAIRWKMAAGPAEREEAKRGMINVVFGLIIIMLAATLISMIYVVPPEAGGDAVTTTTTTTLAGFLGVFSLIL